MSSILFCDLEVENHEYYGSKASPYCPLNYVVESGWRVDRNNTVGKVQSIRFNSREEFLAAPASSWLSIPDDCWLIVCHNAAYEISWFLSFARQEFEAFLKRGGRVWCTMHGEYLTTAQQSLYPSLDETAPKYAGSHKVDGIKILWEQGVLTSEIDPLMLHKYLTDPKEGDVANTATVFYGQTAVLAEENMMGMCWERMDALLAFAYCEWFGLYVNKPIADANQAEQEAEIQRLKDELKRYMPEDLPTDLEFNYGSLYHMSALVFGGSVKYRTKVSYNPVKYEKYDAYLVDVNGTKQYVAVEDIPDTATYPHSIESYKSGRNKGQPKVFKVDSNVEKLKWADAFYTFKGIVSIDSLPSIFKEKLYWDEKGRRGEWVTALSLPCGTPVFSTGTDIMEALAKQGYEFGKLVSELAALEKDVSTYYLREELDAQGNVKRVKGMLQYIIPTSPDGSGIIHHRLNTTATITGRLSSSNPNLQNLPRDGTSKVKQMFTSRFGEQGRIIEVDYSALEVVMSCVHTGDTKLLELLQANTDMHCYRLAFKENMPYEEVYKLCHDETGADYKVWKQKRTDIKAPSFAAQYGATAKGIAFATGVSEKDAQDFLDNEAKLFPVTIGFRQKVRAIVEQSGMQKGNLKRMSMDDGSIKLVRTGYWQSPAGTKYAFTQKEQWKERADGRGKEKVLDYKDTEMANFWNQGEAFFLMAVAFGMLIRHLISNNFYNGQVCLITNVHDAAYLDAANAEVGRKAALATKKIMEDARLRIAKLWPNYGIISEVPFPAAAEMGSSMYNKTHVE